MYVWLILHQFLTVQLKNGPAFYITSSLTITNDDYAEITAMFNSVRTSMPIPAFGYPRSCLVCVSTIVASPFIAKMR